MGKSQNNLSMGRILILLVFYFVQKHANLRNKERSFLDAERDDLLQLFSLLCCFSADVDSNVSPSSISIMGVANFVEILFPIEIYNDKLRSLDFATHDILIQFETE